jgi:hypothetical protein
MNVLIVPSVSPMAIHIKAFQAFKQPAGLAYSKREAASVAQQCRT